MNQLKTIHKKIVLIVMLLILSLSMIAQTIQNVYAHSVFYLAVTIDSSSFIYTGHVLQDDEGFWSREAAHLEYDVGEFDDINIKNRNVDAISGDSLDLSKVTNKGVREYLAFSLPSKEDGNNHASDKEIDKVYLAQDYVVQGLNDAIIFMNKGQNPSSMTELNEISVKLLKYTTIQSSGGKVTHDGIDYNISFSLPSGFKVKSGFKSEDYVTITRATDNEFITVPFQLDKEETIDGVNATYFHWGGFVLHAWQAASEGKDIFTQNAGSLSKPSKLTEVITDLIGFFTNELRSLLGLYSLNDLIFNEGSRGSNAFIHGIAPKSWVDSALTYHLIFQGFAMSLLLFSIVKTLLQRNLATVNTNIRVSLIEGFQNIIVAAIGLALIIPLMNSLMYLNFIIAGFFGTTVPDYTALSDTTAYTNLLGGAVMQLVYFGIGLYYNFVYIIRSITIVILIAVVPLFIVAFAFGGQWKSYFWAWFKEFIANVFMQSFHAMMLSLFFTFTLTSRGIESIVVLMAIIPLSNFFRKIIFGGAGDATSDIGMGSLSMATALGTTALNHTNKLLPSKNSNANTATAGNGNSNTSSQSNATASNSKANSNATKLKSSTSSDTNLSNNGNGSLDTSRTISPANSQYQGLERTVSPADLQSRMNKANTDRSKFSKGMSHAKNIGKVGKQGARIAGDAARVVTGAAGMAVGYGTGMALGADEFKMMVGAQKLNETSTKGLNDGSTALKDTGKSAINNSDNRFANSFKKKEDDVKIDQFSNGDMGVNESFNSFKSGAKGQAIDDAFMDKDSNLVMFYNESKLNGSQQQFFSNVKQAYKDNNTEEIEGYRKMGIQSIGTTNNGQTAVTYNQEGKRRMGIREMNMDHKNKRVNTVYAPGGQMGDNVEAATIKPDKPFIPQQKSFNGNGQNDNDNDNHNGRNGRNKN